MGSKKRILIIHPEGNIYNNPNLYEIIKLLNNKYKLELFLPNLDVVHSSLEFKQIIKIYNNIFNRIFNKVLKNYFLFKLFYKILEKIYLSKKHYDLIIGVDQLGLILASELSQRLRVPYGLISYEIFFQEECGYEEKKLEIKASNNLDFVIIQDEIRAKFLSIENKISVDKMITMPVSSSKTYPYSRKYSIHNELSIPKNKKILIFVGSISNWTCIDKILINIHNFPDSWVLVLHDRYGDTQKRVQTLYPSIFKQKNKKIYFSNMKIKDTNDMHKLLHSVDLGLATYCPDFNNKYTGKNIEFIGLASGKINTYLQNGLPVVTTSNEVLEESIKENNLGFSITSLDEIPDILKHFKPSQRINDSCIEFFSKKLSFDNYSKNLLNIIDKLLKYNK